MSDLSLLTWVLVLAALVLGILAGHFGWGKRWSASFSKLHPDYLTGLDYLVTEQPDRALDMFLKLMDANADTIETHFALGALYRRAARWSAPSAFIRISWRARIWRKSTGSKRCSPWHRTICAPACLIGPRVLFQQVSEVPRLRVSALDSLRGVYELQHDWQQALETYRQLARIKSAPPRTVAAHYLCELAALAIERGDIDAALRLLARSARRKRSHFRERPLLSAQIAEHESQPELAVRLLREALADIARLCCRTNCRICSSWSEPSKRDAILAELVAQAERVISAS